MLVDKSAQSSPLGPGLWPNYSGHLYILLYIINKSSFTLLSIKKTNIILGVEILQITLGQNCLQFDTLTMILDTRIKSQEVSEEEHDFLIDIPIK